MTLRSFSFLVVVILFTSFAFGNVTTSGSAIPTGSWTQQFNESGVGPFNNMVFTIDTPGVTWGDTANPTGINAFNPSDGYDWGSTNSNGGKTVWAFYNYYGVPYPSDLNFNLTFSSDQGTPLGFDFFTYDDQKLVDRGHAGWNGGGWDIKTYSTSTPEPATLTLLGIGLIGAGIRRKLK